MSETVGMFCRVSPSTRELLAETLRGMNSNVPPGERGVGLGVLVERCVLQTLADDPHPDRVASGAAAVAADQALERGRARARRVARKRRAR